MNEYEKIIVEALVQDELKTRLKPFTEHAREIIDYLRSPVDKEKPWVINTVAHAGADMLSELVAVINARLES